MIIPCAGYPRFSGRCRPRTLRPAIPAKSTFTLLLALTAAVLVITSVVECSAQNSTPIELQCPADTAIPSRTIADSAVVAARATGGCGPVTLSHSDESSTPDTSHHQIIRRTWTASDTCGQKQTCVQILTLTPSPSRVAILPLENLAESEEGARVFARLLQDQLAQLPNLEVIPSGEIETATLHARIRLPVLMDNDQTRHLRQALDADYFLVGSVIAYQTINDAYSGVIPTAGLTLQLRDAATGSTVWSDTFHETGNSGEWLFGLGAEHDITRLAHSIARRAVNRLSKAIRSLPCERPVR